MHLPVSSNPLSSCAKCYIFLIDRVLFFFFSRLVHLSDTLRGCYSLSSHPPPFPFPEPFPTRSRLWHQEEDRYSRNANTTQDIQTRIKKEGRRRRRWKEVSGLDGAYAGRRERCLRCGIGGQEKEKEACNSISRLEPKDYIHTDTH